MARRVVVDGSNLATEGRSLPSLAQLNDAVRSFGDEHAGDDVIVVVDASFGYRIDESERKEYEQAELAGAIVSPPAGAIGRGDGFLLQIADRTGATVLSNDSFQEFHGEYSWLFADGRLIGGKPVPGVGWIFTARTPVRGARSRMSVQEAKASKGKAKEKATPKAKVSEKAAKPNDKAKPKEKAKPKDKSRPVVDVIAEATADVIAPARAKRRRRRDKAPADPVNEPLPFITFIANHPLGSEVEGTVDSFASHGAFVTVDGARCYVPISGLGAPSLRSAKEVLGRGEKRTFVVQALDPPRRGIELALPGLAQVAGVPTEETVAAEITQSRPQKARPGTRKKAAPEQAAPTKKQAAARATAVKAVAAEKSTRGRTTGGKTTSAKTPARKAAAKQTATTAAKQTPAKQTATKQTAAGRRTAAQAVAAKTVAAKTVAAAKKAVADSVAAPEDATAARRPAGPTRRKAATARKKAAAESAP
jgi:hypothetical protein